MSLTSYRAALPRYRTVEAAQERSRNWCATLLPTAGTWALCQSGVQCARSALQGSTTSITILRVSAHTRLPALLLSESLSRWLTKVDHGEPQVPPHCTLWQAGGPCCVRRSDRVMVAVGWTRTIDIWIMSPALYQLSYPAIVTSTVPAFHGETDFFVLLHHRSHPSLRARATAFIFISIHRRVSLSIYAVYSWRRDRDSNPGAVADSAFPRQRI